SSGFSTRGSFTMRQVKCLRCNAAAWPVRCSPLNWALCSSTGSTETKRRQPNVFELTELYSFCL
ncbi:hypothetical protein, partial [Vibrio anguillarum]|uniref:hypothetical protein n=1 Tax=Vibrio anguillarum TaxID=55601 RepID=UPI001BE4A31D